MTELIGVTTVPRNFKKRLLIFDRIAFPGAQSVLDAVADQTHAQSDDGGLEWLIEQGIVFIPDVSESHLPVFLPLTARSIDVAGPRRPPTRAGVSPRRPSGISVSIDLGSPSRPLPGAPDFVPYVAERQMFWATMKDLEARRWAIQLRAKGYPNTVPITLDWESPSGWAPLSLSKSGDRVESDLVKAHVIDLVINSLPTPDDTHSLEDIIAFRDEAKLQGLTQGLRVWMNEVASGTLTGVEIADKLEDLVSRYETTLRLEKLRRETGVVESLVCTTAEIAESLVKFQWAALAKKLFEVRHRQIDLMRAELTLPGREVAYIVKARERFGSS